MKTYHITYVTTERCEAVVKAKSKKAAKDKIIEGNIFGATSIKTIRKLSKVDK